MNRLAKSTEAIVSHCVLSVGNRGRVISETQLLLSASLLSRKCGWLSTQFFTPRTALLFLEYSKNPESVLIWFVLGTFHGTRDWTQIVVPERSTSRMLAKETTASTSTGFFFLIWYNVHSSWFIHKHAMNEGQSQSK